MYDIYDDCAECSARGDDYYINKDGESVCRCHRCSVHRMTIDNDDCLD